MNAHASLDGYAPAHASDSAAAADRVLAYLRGTPTLPAQCIRPARFAAISRVLGQAGPTLSRPDLELLADIFLFIFAVDDLVDEGDLAAEDVELRLSQYMDCAVGKHCPEVAFDPLARCLLSIAARLHAAPIGADLWAEWDRRVREFLGAMLTAHQAEADLAAGRPAPDLRTYMKMGRHNIGIAFMSMAAWIVIGEPALVKRLPRLVAAERHLSQACRLANDLRTHERELQEGTLNALSITGVAGAPLLRRRVTENLRAGRKLLNVGTADVAVCAQFLDGFASAVIDLYETQDFHTQAA